MCLFLNGVESYDKIKLAIDLLTPFSILLAFIAYRTNRKRHYFDAIQACQKRYLNIVQQQQQLDLQQGAAPPGPHYHANHLVLFRDHMGLVCEEITYIRQGMLPRFVALSWLSAMASRVPFFVEGRWVNARLMERGENKVLVEQSSEIMLATFRSFELLSELFSEERYRDDLCFYATDGDQLMLRQRFARMMYRRIRRSRRNWRKQLKFGFNRWLHRSPRSLPIPVALGVALLYLLLCIAPLLVCCVL
ncbi:hypothetical protein [Mangrovibacterium lignilyticum]|uniref:hypothetical protein n=1 Tax=Mangrovibacterium lignilyticum TaxID=2668052 RepID=UPI0013D162EC|nr:hypothetical protein [Mangrovibacterium lignilyticum]